ncbi:hypothetical protein BGZ95_008437 [Linnemannia exigua]|uniref:RRM Nup35-type domain-containing protein n=1 Tax=Linnemannia exigua TaxID=604196 RepID=A0AAD4DE22_9FUNG|nr:hypothetical protein BGZ95_008437 [Linnemannia exigua]
MSMFTFDTKGSLSSSQGRSSTSSTKSNYVPSTYIAKQLQLEEEARRQGHQLNGSQNGISSRTDSTQHWRGPGDVLAPGYSSGPLGYHVPPSQTTTTSSTRFKPLFDETVRTDNNNNRDDISGAGVGIGIQGVPSLDNNTTTSPTTTRLYPNLNAPASPDHSSSPRGILRGGDQRQDLNKDEGVLRKSTSVRFNAANDVGSTRPATPSIYNQNGANSPFFNSPYIHSSANLQSALKEPGKVDVLSHRAASTGQPERNSSLGPALGSVSGTAQSPTTYSSPKMQNDILPSSMRNNSNNNSQYQGGISGGSGSVFQFGTDGNLVRQNSKVSPLLGKANLDEDEDDKEKERYMPAILLSTAGFKGSKIEPFVDGDERNEKSDWETNNSFQQAQSTSSRVAPHLIGEDAPPTETLFDVAKKEKYYSRQAQAPTFDKTTTLTQDTRTDSTMNGASQGGEVATSPSSQGAAALGNTSTSDGVNSIITYGFPPEATSYVLNQFRSFGMILRYESGVYGKVEAESFNWLKIQYTGAWAARNAVTRHLKSVGKFIVGVHACRSFSAQMQSPSPDMSMDTSADGDIIARQTTTRSDITEAEAREVQAGVDTLLRMRAQGLHADVGHTHAAQSASTRARHASLYESWSQGGGANGLGHSQLGATVDRFAGASTLGASGAEALGRSSAVDQGDDDMAYILSHSLTSGGSLARSGRGRGFERGVGGSQDEFLRSRSKDQLGQDQEQKLVGGESVLGLESKAAESSIVGFRPLFGQSESRGLNSSSGAGTGPDSLLQQQFTPSHSVYDTSSSSRQQQQQVQQEALFGSRHNQHRTSLRRPLGESAVSDSTLFASTGGVLMDSDVLGASTSSAPGSLYHVQKKQRLSSSLFAPSSSAPSGNVSQAQFGIGRNRASVLIDNPELVDEWGTPLLSKMKVPGTATGSGAAAAGGAGANGGGAESMITSVFNMAKKRLFWG